ncbi:hypothetical protein KIM372_06230 [Bombiscardovia nodaiensis]|uniref:DUF5082 domain-containing protein n=1 Tax=Bombiscardovia nodaiensis TaxID=2932181 RepID=A0ABM8B7S6_9BIFI|nr:hypothetical protein KIM372_06230 [Bombiscardovia nodaiensis]
MSSDLEDVQRQMDAERQRMSNAQTENEIYDGQIERLQKACDAVQDYFKLAKDFTGAVQHYDLGDSWRGDTRERFDSQLDQAGQDVSRYADGVLLAYRYLRDEITRLENKENDNRGLIGRASSALNNLSNWFQKLTNG